MVGDRGLEVDAVAGGELVLLFAQAERHGALFADDDLLAVVLDGLATARHAGVEGDRPHLERRFWQLARQALDDELLGRADRGAFAHALHERLLLLLAVGDEVRGAHAEPPGDLQDHRDAGDHLLGLDLLNRRGRNAALARELLQRQVRRVARRADALADPRELVVDGRCHVTIR